ncbi:MAG TPA: hypothetical protein VJT54_03450 [Verrucomicrobiae bacterium]|nr:hypothetical protein [Verrucomicrobiae bacterium]
MVTTNISNAPVAWYIRVLQQPVTSFGLAALCLALDFSTEPYITFPITFIIPVAIAAWFCRSPYAYSLAIIQPLVRLSFTCLRHSPGNINDLIANSGIRVIVLVLLAYLISRTARQTRELARRVNLLEGILPICSLCKKIRDERGDWQPVEIYVSNRTDALFSHSLCPDCLKRDYRHIQAEG